MTRVPPVSDRLQRIGVVYVLIMLLMTVGGIRADQTPRVIMAGTPTEGQWDGPCGCSTGRIRMAPFGTLRMAATGGDLLNRHEYAIVFGHLVGSQMVVDRVVELGVAGSDPNELIEWMRKQRPLAAVALSLLATFGWDAISFMAALLASLIAGITCAIAMDVVALRLDVGLADPGWAATMIAGGCAGWCAARHFDAVLEGRAQAMVMSLAAALLFRDMAGVVGGVAGIALPALSRRVALGFLMTIAAAVVLGLPDFIFQFSAGSGLVAAGIDRWRAANHSASRRVAA